MGQIGWNWCLWKGNCIAFQICLYFFCRNMFRFNNLLTYTLTLDLTLWITWSEDELQWKFTPICFFSTIPTILKYDNTLEAPFNYRCQGFYDSLISLPNVRHIYLFLSKHTLTTGNMPTPFPEVGKQNLQFSSWFCVSLFLVICTRIPAWEPRHKIRRDTTKLSGIFFFFLNVEKVNGVI